MIFPVDKFIGKSDGEDLFYEKLKSFLPKNYVSFHNQDIGMEEADVIILVPNKGLLVVEIKSFRPHNINKARDNKYILKTNGEIEFSPFKQAARYRNSLIEKLKSHNPEYGKYVVAYVPCFPFFSYEDLLEKDMGKICDVDLFINKDDILSFENLSKRLEFIFECANKIDIPGLKRNMFSDEEMVLVSNIIMPNSINLEDIEIDMSMNTDSKAIYEDEYSYIYVRSNNLVEPNEECKKIIDKWKRGTKIYYYSNSKASVSKIYELVKQETEKFKTKVYPKEYDELNISNLGEKYGFFNFTIEYSIGLNKSFEIKNGEINEEQKNDLKALGKLVHFNAEQFFAEHSDTKNMLVNAGAGTGKTYLLVSRIAFLTWKHKYTADELRKRIALITFTNDATNEMRSRLEQYFSKMFILTFDKKYYAYIECVENMTIRTIDSFSKKIVSKFAYNLGLGNQLKITSATIIKQKMIRAEINDYLRNDKKSSELAIPSYEMEKKILELIKKIEDRNKDPREIQELFDKSFLMQSKIDINDDTTSNYDLVQKDLASMFLRVPSIMRKIEDECERNNQILMGQIIVYLGRVVELMKAGAIKKPDDVEYEYVFIDEFQDTDDKQILLVSEFQKLFKFCLFVVGDVKQSIYRFRGANDDRAFAYLKEMCEDSFLEYDLVKNYRTNVKMLDYFDQVFKRLNAKKGKKKDKGLLAYSEKDVLIGVNFPDYPAQVSNFYFSTEEEREEYICNIIKNHASKNETMAILVRKNQQVSKIKEICERNDIYNVDIDTGGALYQQEAAIDLFKLLYALQNNMDEAALFNLYTTAYVNNSLDKNELLISTDKRKYFYEHLPDSLIGWESYVEKIELEPVLRVVREIIDNASPWNIYAQRLKGDEEEREISKLRYKSNLDKLFEKIAIETNGMYLTLNSLVESLKIMITTSQEEEERTLSKSFNIQCRTVHRAKGKEYDYVFLPYADDVFEKMKPKYNSTFILCEDGIGYFLPIDGVEYKNDIFEREDAKEREEQSYEEARIFYVALTRAKKGVVYLETMKRNKQQTSWFEMLREK